MMKTLKVLSVSIAKWVKASSKTGGTWVTKAEKSCSKSERSNMLTVKDTLMLKISSVIYVCSIAKYAYKTC